MKKPVREVKNEAFEEAYALMDKIFTALEDKGMEREGFELFCAFNNALGVSQSYMAVTKQNCREEIAALKARCHNQKFELRRLNKLLAYIRMGLQAAEAAKMSKKEEKDAEIAKAEYWANINKYLNPYYKKEEPKQ